MTEKTKAKNKSKSASKSKKTTPKVPYHKKPEKMDMDTWQMALRRQFAENLAFDIKKLGAHPVFSDYNVYNPSTRNTYKVALRSKDNTLNFCTCFDFKTNGLGTCKHIETVLHFIKKKKTLIKILNQDYTPPYSSIYLKYGAERKVMLRLGTEDTKKIAALSQNYFNELYELRDDAFNSIEMFLKKARSINPSFRFYEDAMSFIINIRAKKSRANLLESISENGNGNDQYWDNIIKAKLFPYQKEGVKFAVRAGRCLIADDMGLGKTIQAIAATELLRRELNIGRALIVCPTSLKYQWKTEIEKFTESKVKVIEGNLLKRAELYKEDDSHYHIISYNVVANDVAYINKYKPDLVILDEAQRIKNWKTKVAKGVKKLESDYAIVLTGTPLENKLEELYSIVQFVDVLKLGALFRFLDNHQVKDETGKVTGYQGLHKINNVLSDIMLRRTKKEVLKQLPARMDKNLFVPMTREQMDVHNDYQEMAAKLAFKWRRMGFLDEKDRQRLLLALNCMRMVCDSTYILDQKTRHDTKIEELMSILDEALDDDDQKVVVFSQWERMTRLVAQELEIRGIMYENLNGNVPSEKRKELFDNFNNNPQSRIFLSTDAGGVGLNLQAASLLINLDIPWNPAVLEQRIARIYRLGQKKNVNIINMVSSMSFEHKMLDVLKFKSSLAEGILDKGEDAIFMEDSKFNQFMKSVESFVGQKEPESEDDTEIVADKEDQAEEAEMGRSPEIHENSKNKELLIGKQLNFLDDDVAEKGSNENNAPKVIVGLPEAQMPANDLISVGVNFLEKLTQTLSDKEATNNLIASLTEKDEKTGKTYVKIPVENEKIVENAVNLLAGFLKAFQK